MPLSFPASDTTTGVALQGALFRDAGIACGGQFMLRGAGREYGWYHQLGRRGDKERQGPWGGERVLFCLPV